MEIQETTSELIKLKEKIINKIKELGNLLHYISTNISQETYNADIFALSMGVNLWKEKNINGNEFTVSEKILEEISNYAKKAEKIVKYL